MCWKCGPVRPYDGPKSQKIGRTYAYLVGDVVYDANEDSDWEAIDRDFPDWEDVDAEGNRYFFSAQRAEDFQEY